MRALKISTTDYNLDINKKCPSSSNRAWCTNIS